MCRIRVQHDLDKINKSYNLSQFVLLVSDFIPQAVAQHLRWIMQKDLLGQDVFLIGPPGPLRRSIAMQYLVSMLVQINIAESLRFNVPEVGQYGIGSKGSGKTLV